VGEWEKGRQGIAINMREGYIGKFPLLFEGGVAGAAGTQLFA
jgi:hypothetical protein